MSPEAPVRALVVVLISAMMAPGAVPQTCGIDRSQAPAPLVEMSMSFVVDQVDLFPTKGWDQMLNLVGQLAVTKARPDDLVVDLVSSIDNDWWQIIEPQTMVFHYTGEEIKPFKVKVFLEPYTFGPPQSILEATATARLPGRDEAATATMMIRFLTDTEQFMTSFPNEIVVLSDRGVDGKTWLWNMLDRPAELHLGVLGEGVALLPHIDFQDEIVLQPNERYLARFHGKVADGVSEGWHKVTIALWTVDDQGERVYITSENVTLDVTTEDEGALDTIYRLAIPIVAIALGAAVLMVYAALTLRGRRREASMETNLPNGGPIPSRASPRTPR